MSDRLSDFVLDASVAAKCFFEEEGRDEALDVVAGAVLICAPELIFAEMASLASKKVRQGQIPVDLGRDALAALDELLVETTPTRDLASHAYELAAAHGVSAYDGLYLALAMQREMEVLTADARFARKSSEVGLGRFVRMLLVR